MSPPPYCTRIPAGSYSIAQNQGISSLEREPRGGCTNQAFIPSAPPPPYEEFINDCHESGLPRYSSLSHHLSPPAVRAQPRISRRRSPSINVFILWVTIILIPTVILVGTLVVVLISTE